MGNPIRKRGQSMRRTEHVVGSARLHLHPALLRMRAVFGVAVGSRIRLGQSGNMSIAKIARYSALPLRIVVRQRFFA
jgi:hypothetical protein